MQPGESPVDGAENRPGGGEWAHRSQGAVGDTLANILRSRLNMAIYWASTSRDGSLQSGDFQQGGDMRSPAFLGGEPVVEMLEEEGRGTVQGFACFFLDLIQAVVMVLQGCHITLVNQVFFGFDVVVEAGFGQAQAFGDIPQRGGARALGIKQLGRLRQDCRALGIVLGGAVER